MGRLTDIDLEGYSPASVEGEWVKAPQDLTIARAARLVERIRGRKAQILALEDLNLFIPPAASIVMAPEFGHYHIVKAGQVLTDAIRRQRGGSVHQVGFGELEIRREDGCVKTISVAVKPNDSFRKSFQELAITTTARARGVPTLRFIGLMNDSSGQALDDSFLFSVAENVQTLDLEPWQQMYNYDPRVERHFQGRLKQMSQALAGLHVRGIRHGDPQLKNYWVKPNGRLEAIDFESGWFYSNPPTAEEYYNFAKKDLSRLFIALTRPNADFQTEVIRGSFFDRVSQFNKLIYQPYNDLVIEELIGKAPTNDRFEAVAQLEDEIKSGEPFK